MRVFLSSLGVVAISLIIFLLGDAWNNVELGFGEAVTDSNSLPRNGLAAVFVALGMLAQVLTTRLKNEKGVEVDMGLHLRLVVKSRDFWLAALISPMVLMVALQTAAQQSSLMLVCLLAFQNGFFFRSILDSAKR